MLSSSTFELEYGLFQQLKGDKIMADVTVKQLAQVVGIPVERLLNQLQEAGLTFNNEHQSVNEEQKRILLNHLKGGSTPDKGSAPERITLRRKSVSQVTLGHDAHSGKTVNIEVRKKRTYEKRSSVPEQLPEEIILEEETELEEISVAPEAPLVTDETSEVIPTELTASEETAASAEEIPAVVVDRRPKYGR